MVSRNKYVFLAIIWAGIILILLSLPSTPAEGIPYISYLGHFLLFFIFGSFLKKSTDKKGLLTGMAYAFFTEIWQLFIPLRFFGIYDLIFDFLGIAMIYLIMGDYIMTYDR